MRSYACMIDCTCTIFTISIVLIHLTLLRISGFLFWDKVVSYNVEGVVTQRAWCRSDWMTLWTL